MPDRPEGPSVFEELILIVVGAIVTETAAARRERILLRVNREIGDPAVVDIEDGAKARRQAELRALWQRLLPTWLA